VLLICFVFQRLAASLIWPFMALFILEQTGAALSSVTVLLSIQAVSSLVGTSLISALMDVIGRRRPMLLGLAAMSIVLLLMSQAHELWQWALLIAAYGTLHPVFMVGSNAMVADIVPPEQRTGAYALLRTGANVAIATGPVVGGIFIAQSHLFGFSMAAFLNVALLLPVALFMVETLPGKRKIEEKAKTGFATLLRDKPFLMYMAIYALLEVAAALVFNLLAVYVNQQFNIQEDGYGRILAMNALMVVLFQYPVTRITIRWQPFPTLALGATFYAIGLVCFGLSSTPNTFALSMVVMTIGELIVAPTSTALVANMAPPAMRARYMGIYALAFTFGTGIGPLFGGILSDAFAPNAIWFAGALVALISAPGFLLLGRFWQQREQNI
jgi:predicted MFS family arabinose efflux permease